MTNPKAELELPPHVKTHIDALSDDQRRELLIFSSMMLMAQARDAPEGILRDFAVAAIDNYRTMFALSLCKVVMPDPLATSPNDVRMAVAITAQESYLRAAKAKQRHELMTDCLKPYVKEEFQ